MAKSKKKQLNKKKKVTAQRRPRIMIEPSMGSAKLARSWANPFEVSACIPDGSRNVGCFSLRQTGQLITGVTGTIVGVAVNADYNNNLYTDVTSNNTALTVCSGNWSASAGATTALANYSKYRVVSMGLRLTFIGASLSDSGVLVGGVVSGGTPLSTLGGKSVSSFANLFQNFKTIPIRNGMTIVWRPNDVEDCTQFINPVTTGATTQTFNSNYLAAWAFGAATGSSTVLQWETIVNYEGQYNNMSFVPGGVEQVGASNEAEPGWYEKATNMVSKLTQVMPTVGNYALDFAADVATRAITGANGVPYRGVTSGFKRLI